MPLLGKVETEKLYLPSTESATNEADKAWIFLKAKLTLGDLADIEALEDYSERAITAIRGIITDWNYTEDGTAATPKLEITNENVRKLDVADFNHIANWLSEKSAKAKEGLSVAEKKASTVSSTEEAGPTPTPQPTIPNTEEQ